jgi:flagellin-like protein
MTRKGITPVVAVVLLMGITVAGGYAIYQSYSSAQSAAREYEPNLRLSKNQLNIESCWGDPNNPKLAVRNTGEKAVNVTGIPIQINGSDINRGSEYSLSKQIVDPQETFRITITISDPINPDTRISILTTTETIRYKCLNIA